LGALPSWPEHGPEPAHFGADGPPLEAIAALQAHPRFSEAIRSIASNAVARYQGNRLLNTLVNDRGRLLIGYLAMYLHHSSDDGRPGLTLGRMKALCVEQNICSANRAEAIVMMMRLFGYLAPASGAEDRRMRLLVPTERLTETLEQRWRDMFEAAEMLMPEGTDALMAMRRPQFVAGFAIELVKHFLAGFRFLDHAPGLELFAERNGGLTALLGIALAGETGDTFPPKRPVPVSISGIAGRFGVSRVHVRKLLRDAQATGLIERAGADENLVVLSARLNVAIEVFFASSLLYFAHCSQAAIAAMVSKDAAA
jgi:hypothetical protein